MFKIFEQPYPFQEKTNTRVWIQSFAEGAFIALFLNLFQPFGISLWQEPNKVFYLIGYGLMTTLGGLVLRFGIFRAFPKYYRENSWTIAKEIGSVLTLVTLITLANMLYSSLAFGFNQGLMSFVGMFFAVIIIGVFPIIFGVMLNYIFQLKKYEQPFIISHTQPIGNQKSDSEIIKLVAENEKDLLEIKAESLIYIESSDNYSTIFFETEGTLQKELIRSSLTRLEGQIHQGQVVRCHRSFIVNLAKVNQVSGNAQGYKLHFSASTSTVPVARKYAEIIERLK